MTMAIVTRGHWRSGRAGLQLQYKWWPQSSVQVGQRSFVVRSRVATREPVAISFHLSGLTSGAWARASKMSQKPLASGFVREPSSAQSSGVASQLVSERTCCLAASQLQLRLVRAHLRCPHRAAANSFFSFSIVGPNASWTLAPARLKSQWLEKSGERIFAVWRKNLAGVFSTVAHTKSRHFRVTS